MTTKLFIIAKKLSVKYASSDEEKITDPYETEYPDESYSIPEEVTVHDIYPEEVTVHGTYPFEVRHSPWKRVCRITPSEASSLLDLPRAGQPGHKRNPASFRALADGPRMLNKGYVVIRYHNNLPNKLENIIKYKYLKTGDKAIYLHDQTYWLIEFVGEQM